MDDPIPISITETNINGYEGAWERHSKPINVNPIPIGSEYGCDFLSVYSPTKGCKIDADNWKTRVIMPICEKLRLKLVLIIGYIAGISDCTISLSR